MSTYDRYIKDLEIRRERILNGKINCIPISFDRFSHYFPGLEKRKYGLFTAVQKAGKSKCVDKMYVYDPLFYALEHTEQLRIKIIYFTLEMGKQEKFYEFLSHLLWCIDGIRCSPTKLKSVDQNNPVSEEILKRIKSEKYKPYIDAFEQTVDYVDDIKNPYGIYDYCRKYAESRGHWVYKKGYYRNEKNEKVETEQKDYFQQDDEEEYLIVVLDNFTNLMAEKSESKMQTIEKMSKYFIELRDKYNFHIIGIQHQAQNQESLDNRKNNSVEPSSDGLGDCKVTIRDINYALGLFPPYKYGIKKWPDGPECYDITRFRNYIRFLKIMENRDGESAISTPLFFDGAVSEFMELPRPDNLKELSYYYEQIEKISKK